MSAECAQAAFLAWHRDAVLADKRVESGWVKNDEGRGDYGLMKAMMFGRLESSGPKMEAMGNMGPFENFLLLVGKVPGNTQSCPAT